jgi:transposase
MDTKIKKSQRASKVYNTLPTKVTRKEFNTHIKKYLTKNKRGVKPALSYWKIFNYILYTLHTGVPWYTLPVKEVHWSNIYKHHNRWSKDGSYEKIFNGSLEWLAREEKLDLSALHGSNVVAKKGAKK